MRIQYLDFQKTRKTIVEKIKEAKNMKTKVALQILLIQLVNGARISEAYEAYYKFCETGQREVYVRVRKKRRPETRAIDIPPEVIPICVKVNPDSVRRVCKQKLGINSHSLRYAYITYLSQLNIPAHVVSKITHHSKPELVEYYTHQLLAQRIQRKIALNKE